MLYDVLLALFGHAGDIIVESEKKNGNYKVVDEIKLSTSERSAITAILKTGQLYRSIKKFCIKIGIDDYYSDLSVLFVGKGSTNLGVDYVNDTTLNLGTKNLSNSNGYHMIAFCNGIQRYLGDYRKLLLTLEDVATSVKVLPTSTFTIIMRDQNKILHCLQTIILDYQNASERYEERDVFSKSRDLLEILSEKPKDKSLRDIYTKLRRDVLSFLKFQLRNWICSGHLLDPYGEFVIGYRDLKNVNQDCQIPLNTLQTSGVSETNYHSRLLEYEWNYKFYIKLKRGSTFGPIDYKTSKSMLFIGKVIRVLSRSLNDFTINRTGIKKNLYSAHLVHLADRHIFDVWNKICSDVDLFQAAVETYRKYVSELFREFVDRNLNIKHQLKLFKDVYLMGFDSIYNSFFDKTYDHMSIKYNETSFRLINKEFGKAISILNRKDEDVNDKFEYLEDTDSGNLEDVDKNGGMFIRNGGRELFINGNNLSQSKKLNVMGSSGSGEMNSYLLINSSEMSSYSHESADTEELMKNYELNITQTHKIRDEESFEMFKHINDFNINSKFIKINKVKHKDSVIVGSNSSIWYEQVVYIMNSFNISLVANLSKITKFKQFSVILSSKYFNSFEDGQKNELDTNNTKAYEKDYSSGSSSDHMYNNSDINRDDEKGQKNNLKKYISIDFKFINNDGKLKILIKIMYNNVYNNNNMLNKSVKIYSKEQTFKYNSKDKELHVEVALEFDKSNLKVNLKEFKEKLNKSMTHYSIEKLYDKSFSGESRCTNNYMDEDDDYLSEEDFDDDEELRHDSELNKSRLFFRSTKSKSFKDELKSEDIDEKNKTNNINGIKRDNLASMGVESKISEVLEMFIEIKSFDIIELLKLMSDSLYVGIINHTPEGTNKVTSTNKEEENSTKKVRDGKKNRIPTFSGKSSINSNSKDNSTDKGDGMVDMNNNSIEGNGKTSKNRSDNIHNDTNASTNNTSNTTNNHINNNNNSNTTNNHINNNNTSNAANNHINNNNTNYNAEDDSIELLIFDYYTILNRCDLMPYYKDKKFIKNSKYTKSIRNLINRYTSEEETLESDIGINEWIYVLLNYKYRYINFVNIKSYNNIFQIIFTIKRCLYGLEKRHIIDNRVRRDFTRYQLSKRATTSGTNAANTRRISDASSENPKNSHNEYCNLFRKLYVFKYHLQTNLKLILSYFYNGVIEPKYAELETFVDQSKDFQLIKTKHHVYVENILRCGYGRFLHT
ncbi:hypothetical protein MACJ_001562 [Theileria orientalis]|uniref:Gamma tubulin complex component protein N-terminal domain-containing protein n=1 Tax=Theileria orientalis TaxID=68886 RepID=A0A976M8H3_THEOR|nr:hypothetical protein MACJ_001562 [Theileria orientalis]